MNVIETIEAPYMSARVVEANPSYLGYIVQYEYAREGRARLYGGTQTQQWVVTRPTRRQNGEWGATTYYKTLASARAAAKRLVVRNNG